VNQVLPSKPSVLTTTYVHASPAWLQAVLRVMFGLMSLGLLVLTWRSWAQMPLPARTLALVLAPAFIAVCVWPRLWGHRAKFLADDTGIYFPANELLVPAFRDDSQHPWLHVPWRNISNIRIAREAGEGGRCVALEVSVTEAEASAFFKHVGQPRDGSARTPDALAIAYGDSPPKPETTVQLLLALKARGGA